MKISEYTLLEGAFHNSFKFMLNRLEDCRIVSDWRKREDRCDEAEERCFTEFILALEEMGVELGEVDAALKV